MITKVSEITESDIVSYLRLTTPISESDKKYLNTILSVSKNYILNETGLKEDELDKYNDLVIVVFILCQDMYDNRSLYVEKKDMNKVVSDILNHHSSNLL